MLAAPESTSSAHSGSQTNENLSWTHVLGSGVKLIVVGGIGKETGGEQNPEEINTITFNGVSMTKHPSGDANNDQTGVSFYYLTGANIPVAGSYTVNINYKDSPKYPNAKAGVCASWRTIKNAAPEAYGVRVQSNGSPDPAVTLITLTGGALLVAVYGVRTGEPIIFTQGVDMQVESPNNGGEDTAVAIGARIISAPASVTVTVDPNNPESNGLLVAAFRVLNQSSPAGAL